MNTRFGTCVLLLAVCLMCLWGNPAQAAVCSSAIEVANTADNGAGSLRQAIADVCPNGTITFNASLAGQTITLTTGALEIGQNLTIDGGANSVTVSGGGTDRVFIIDPGVTCALKNLTVANGLAPYYDGGAVANAGLLTVQGCTFSGNEAHGDFGGGAIYSGGQATLTVRESTFTGNTATPSGGAVYNEGPLTVTDSTFTGNSASWNCGGGIYNGEGGILTVTGSTFSNNTAAAEGGGIYNRSWFQTMTLANCTFSGNTADTSGGGVFNGNTGTNITVVNCTFSGNGAATAGGNLFVNEESGTVVVANTLMAGAASGGDCVVLPVVNVTNLQNFVQDGSCSASLSGDPLLGALGNNGGPTQTIPLLGGSSAIDAGDDAVCAAAPVSNLDQRGVVRPQGLHCDIGAFELEDSLPPDTTIDSTDPSATPTSSTAMTITFSGTDAGSGVKSFECDLDGGGFSACTSPKAYSGLADGSHTFQVRAIDLFGNADPTPAAYTWVVATTPTYELQVIPPRFVKVVSPLQQKLGAVHSRNDHDGDNHDSEDDPNKIPDIAAFITMLRLLGLAVPLQPCMIIGQQDTVFARGDVPVWSSDALRTVFNVPLSRRVMLALVFVNTFTAQAGTYTVTIGESSGTVELVVP